MDVLYIMMQISAFTVLTVAYLILFGGKSRKKSGYYSQPGDFNTVILSRLANPLAYNPYGLYIPAGKNANGWPAIEFKWNYPLKKWLAKRVVRRWRSEEVQEPELSEPADSPQVSARRVWDSLAFHVSAPDGTLVELTLRQRCNNTAELAVNVALPNGTVYRLPDSDEASQSFEVLDEKHWSAGGLKFVVLEPFVRWRIIYNGLLVKNDSHELTHVKLNFIWVSASPPVRYPEDWGVELAAAALATERWRDGRWRHMLEHSGAGGGWEQWGCMQGILREEESPEVVVRARGVRERWWAPAPSPEATSQVATPPRLHRALSLLAVAYDGNAVYLRAHSHSDRGEPSQAISGSIRFSNGVVESITSSDFSLPEFGDSINELPACYTIAVGASKELRIVIEMELNKKRRRASGLYGLDTLAVPIQVGINGNRGHGLLQLGYNTHKQEWVQLPAEPAGVERLRWTSEESLSEAERRGYCAHFTSAAAASPQLVGAKGASLALLTSRPTDEYSVPPGFCLTTRAMERHIAQHTELAEAIKDIIRVNENYDEAMLKERCARAVELFVETPVEGDVRDEIVAHLDELKKSVVEQKLVDDITFAVRSSAIGEDSEELSAAGQNDTVLGCRGEGQVVRGVQRCWASLYSFHSTQYRRMHGQKADTGMGVVVQAVVPARAAGVLFTRHPNTSHPARILLTANYGLGESVVSGQVEPDTIVLERISDDVRVLSSDVGKKTHRVVLSADGSTEEVALTGDESAASCLTDDECRRLGRLALRQEKLWGAPRDLEWAIYKDKIYLVQARPITSLERWTEFELMHEFDTPVMSEEDYFSFANTGEVLPGALTPLTVSTVGVSLLEGSYRAVNQQPLPPFPVHNPFFLSHYHFGINMYNTMMRRLGKKIDASVRIVEMAVHGHEVADERTHGIALRRNPYRASDKILLTLFMGKSLFGTSTALKKTIRLANSLSIDQVELEDPVLLLQEIEKTKQVLDECMLYHNITSSASVFSQIIAMSVLLEGADQFSLEHLTDIGLMLSSCSDLVSADVPTSLAAIADGVYESGRHAEFCALAPPACLPWLRDNCPLVHDKIQTFLKEHAHRNIKEFDLATKTWGIDSTSLLQAIQSTVKARAAQPERRETKVVMTNKQISANVVSPKRSITRWLLQLVLPLCQRTVGHREGTKAYTILALHKLRLAYLRLAGLLQRAWLLPDPHLIFYFSLNELRTYVHTGDPAFIKKARQRQQHFPKWDALKFAEMNEGHVTPKEARDPRRALVGAPGGARLRGTPVCPGEIIGRACVVTDLAQIGQLQRGDILITHSTDIGWSPYFPLLGGVVTELGGLISHGAVIAREYGLPCIVGAEGATSFCRTGDLVLLAGATGVLERIDPATPTPQPQQQVTPPAFPNPRS